MATQNGKSSSAKSKSKSKAKSGRVVQARAAAERAVDVPVGAVLEVSDRVAGLVEPFSGRDSAEKQFKSFGTRLRRNVERSVELSERRGATARRRAASEARKTRGQVEGRVRGTLEQQASRAQELVGQVGSQLSAIRP